MTRTAILLLTACCLGPQGRAAEPTKLSFDTHSGYFVSNEFEPSAAQSFVVITSQAQLDKVFGAAFVMGDTAHRLPKDAFRSSIVLAAIKRGKELWEYKVTGVTAADGVLEMKYSAAGKTSDTATFASPLIVSVPKGAYKVVHFIENGRVMRKVTMPGEKRAMDKITVKDAAVLAGAIGFIAGWELMHTEKVKVTIKDGKLIADRQDVKPSHSVVFEVMNASKEVHRMVVLRNSQDPDNLAMEGDRVRTKEAGVSVQPGKTARLRQYREDNYEGLFSPWTTFVLFCNEPGHYQKGERVRVTVRDPSPNK